MARHVGLQAVVPRGGGLPIHLFIYTFAEGVSFSHNRQLYSPLNGRKKIDKELNYAQRRRYTDRQTDTEQNTEH